jgi:hypothetical protein
MEPGPAEGEFSFRAGIETPAGTLELVVTLKANIYWDSPLTSLPLIPPILKTPSIDSDSSQ